MVEKGKPQGQRANLGPPHMHKFVHFAKALIRDPQVVTALQPQGIEALQNMANEMSMDIELGAREMKMFRTPDAHQDEGQEALAKVQWSWSPLAAIKHPREVVLFDEAIMAAGGQLRVGQARQTPIELALLGKAGKGKGRGKGRGASGAKPKAAAVVATMEEG